MVSGVLNSKGRGDVLINSSMVTNNRKDFADNTFDTVFLSDKINLVDEKSGNKISLDSLNPDKLVVAGSTTK
jgi:hypothetical protein